MLYFFIPILMIDGGGRTGAPNRTQAGTAIARKRKDHHHHQHQGHSPYLMQYTSLLPNMSPFSGPAVYCI
jgi:hypothetical protein